MKFLIFIIPIFLLSIIGLFQIIYPITFKDYSNNEMGFKISFPTDWRIVEINKNIINFIPSSNQEITASVVIDKTPLDYSNMTLQELSNKWVNETIDNASINITDLNTKDYSLGIYPAIRIESIIDIGFVKQKSIEFGIIIGNYSYRISALAYTMTFDDYIPIFQHILSSFKLLNNQEDTNTITVKQSNYSLPHLAILNEKKIERSFTNSNVKD